MRASLRRGQPRLLPRLRSLPLRRSGFSLAAPASGLSWHILTIGDGRVVVGSLGRKKSRARDARASQHVTDTQTQRVHVFAKLSIHIFVGSKGHGRGPFHFLLECQIASNKICTSHTACDMQASHSLLHHAPRTERWQRKKRRILSHRDGMCQKFPSQPKPTRSGQVCSFQLAKT
ncbi:hypothetical protein B0T22DRAFT_464083 [Podospora appendiculata]|uniref:Uncharacterized protein n=1 Tax=Podospora appendiculata TaxID=314037 RepID=A0AAE1C9S7_9PEZI|nr:hypothetical protein B0T22DRAFT_464083 [Podospora appendiculata]